jgi:hypothetical protein
VIRRRVETKTRRWGSQTTTQNPVSLSVNRFSSVSGFFFYPLLRQLDLSIISSMTGMGRGAGAGLALHSPCGASAKGLHDPVLDESFSMSMSPSSSTAFGYDPLLLSRLLHTLSVIVKYSGRGLETRKMANELFQVKRGTLANSNTYVHIHIHIHASINNTQFHVPYISCTLIIPRCCGWPAYTRIQQCGGARWSACRWCYPPCHPTPCWRI